MKKLVCFMLAAVLSCSVFFTGCTSANVEGSQSAQGETDTKTEAEAEVPTIVRTSISSEPDSLDPWQSAATDTEAIFHNVFEGLFVYNEKGELEPGLAESYDVSEDGLTYTFHLRDNVTFHNGEPMTSADVLYTYENLAGMNGEKLLPANLILWKASTPLMTTPSRSSSPSHPHPSLQATSSLFCRKATPSRASIQSAPVLINSRNISLARRLFWS